MQHLVHDYLKHPVRVEHGSILKPHENVTLSLFPARGGGHMAPSSLYRVWYPAREAAGRPDLRFHDLRHTAACLWLSRSVDPGTVQAWMGHASIATTNIYLHHLGTPADRAGLDRLNTRGYIGGTQGQTGSE